VAHLEGFDAFYAASYHRVVGQVHALLGDLHEAEDVTQDAFAKASFHWTRIAAYDQPEAWVRRVAFNQAHNSHRRARRWLVALARHGPPAGAGRLRRPPGPAPRHAPACPAPP
jgi:RNA polymerase sigma-70 factor (ECF subfamily)